MLKSTGKSNSPESSRESGSLLSKKTGAAQRFNSSTSYGTAENQSVVGNMAMQTMLSPQKRDEFADVHADESDSSSLDILSYFLQVSPPQSTIGAAKIYQGNRSDYLLTQFRSPGLTVGNQVLLSSQLTGSRRNRVLTHELNHVTQVGGRAFTGSGHLRLGDRNSNEEWEARGTPPFIPSRSSIDLNLVRRYDPDNDIENNAVCNEDWSFDPYLEDFSTARNDDLLMRILATREWLQYHSLMELDYQAYSIFLERLDRVRMQRVDKGHLWLEEIQQGQASLLYQLVPGMYGAIDIVAVENLELINGVADELGSQPIMTLNQLQAFRREQGFAEVDLTTFLVDASAVRYRSDEEFASGDYTGQLSSGERGLDSRDGPVQGMEYSQISNLAVWLDELSATGISGGVANSSTHNRLLAEAFVNHNPNSRAGAIAEAYALSNRQSLYGFGVMDRNEMSWDHPNRGTMSGNFPLGDQRSYFGGYPPEASVKMRRSGTVAASSASTITKFDTYLRGYAQMLDMDPNYNGFDYFANNAGNGRTAAEIRADFGLVVSADDADAFRSLLNDPYAFDLTESGNVSDTPNYQRTGIRNIYDGLLQDAPIQLNDGGSALSTVEQIDTALANNRIGVMEHDMYLRQLGDSAAGRVFANTDFDITIHNRFETAYNDLHPSFRPEAPTDSRPVLHSATRARNTLAANSLSSVERYGNYLDRLASIVPEGSGALHVDADDAASVQSLLRDPFAQDTTASGGTSRFANYTRAPVKRAYDAVLSQTPVRGTGGVEYGSIDAIDLALNSGNINAQEHASLINRVGQMAADQVQARTPTVVEANDSAMSDYRQRQAEYRQQLEGASGNIRSAVSPEYMHSIAHGGGVRGDLHVAGSYGGRGAAFGAGLGLLTESYSMLTDERDNPDTIERLAAAGGREGLRGGLSSATESVAMSRVSSYLLREGIEEGGKAMAMRAGARFLPGVVDVGFEAWDMANDGRDNSNLEIGVRSSRALVIGGASSVLGAAAGAAVAGAVAGSVVPGVGTAIGFFAGLVVGIGAALFLNAAIPGGREDWEPGAAERRARDRSRRRDIPMFDVCFALGTNVTMSDGTEKTIETVYVGDEVIAYDEVDKTFKPAKVVKQHVNPPSGTLKMTLDNQRVFRVTPNHRFYIDNNWVRAKDLRPGQLCLSYSRDDQLTERWHYTVIKSIESSSIARTVYNLSIENFHTYIAEGLVVHNVKP